MSTDEQATPAPTHEIPGHVLKARREAMGLSVEQIADQLKLAPRQVVALEAGDYDALPPAAVVRGFVRGYAKVVKVDAAPLVAAIPVDVAAAAADASAGMRRERVAPTMPKVRYPNHGKRSRFPVGALVLGVVVVGAAAAAWQFGLFSPDGGAPATSATEVAPPAVPASGGAAAPAMPPLTETTAAPGAAGTDATLQSPSVPLISVPPVQPADPAAPAAGAAPGTAPAGTEPAAQPPAQQPAAAPVTPPAAVPAAAAPAPAAAGAHALVFDVKQDSWIEVRGASGALVSRLVKAGSTETVNVTGPVTLVVGNPNGVSATLRGAPLALPKLKNSNVSRLKIQ